MSPPSCRPSWRPLLWPAFIAGMIVFASSHARLAAPEVIGIDKLGHFVVFAWLGVLITRCFPRATPTATALFATTALCSLFGATDEWHQSLTPGRSVELADWLADTAGAFTGTCAYLKIPRLRLWLETGAKS